MIDKPNMGNHITDMRLPFLSDKPIPELDKPQTSRAMSFAHAFVYPIHRFPTPVVISMCAIIDPVGKPDILKAYMRGECDLFWYHYRHQSTEILEALEAVIGGRDVSTLVPSEKPVVAFLRGFLWILTEESARELGAKPFSEWMSTIMKSDHDRRINRMPPNSVLDQATYDGLSDEDRRIYNDWLGGAYPLGVHVVTTDERGKTEFAVTLSGNTEFWLTAFDEEQSAINYCMEKGLIIEGVNQ